MKKCKNCKRPFEPFRPLQNVCGLECAIELSNKKGKTDWKLRKKVMKEKVKTHSDYIQELQKIFNSYIRKRDENERCICCDTNISYKDSWDAGHYIPTTKSYLRFNEFNVNKQKRSCNYFKRGNQPNYRIRLIKKYGIEVVEQLEADQNKELELSISDLKEKIIHYKGLLKTMQ